MGTLEAGIPLPLIDASLRSLIGPLYWVKIAILALFALVALFDSRPFCQSACPLGAIYALFNRVSLVQVNLTGDHYTACVECAPRCPTALDLPRGLNSLGCIKCGECVSCPQIRGDRR
jgi:ferredoxin-type protein NapH